MIQGIVDHTVAGTVGFKASLHDHIFVKFASHFLHDHRMQALLGMACDCSRTPWRTPSLSKECGRLHALSFRMRTKISYFSITITIIYIQFI